MWLACPRDDQPRVLLYLFRGRIRPLNSEEDYIGHDPVTGRLKVPVVKKALIPLKEVSDNEEFR